MNYYFTDEWGDQKELAENSLIVVCYNLDGKIDELISEIRRKEEIDEVILVDNASLDNTLTELSKRTCDIEQPSLLIGLEYHIPFVSARNIGLGYATGTSISAMSFEKE